MDGVYDTLTETCLAMGLIENDDEWRRAISEGAAYKMPSVLRRLFVVILIHCQATLELYGMNLTINYQKTTRNS